MCRSIHRYAEANNKYMKNCKFNQEAWLKPYIDISTKLRTEARK